MTLEKGDIAMLNMYEGAAALVWSKISEPNKMFVYHGASRETKNGNIFEERPMFFLEEEEGIYFSSMENSLFSIQDGDNKICCLKYNRVFTIENGLITGEPIVVERDDTNIKQVYTYNRHAEDYDDYPATNSIISSKNGFTKALSNSSSSYADYEGKIFKETLPLRAVQNNNVIYFHKGRFHMPDGSLCEGPVHLMKKGVIATNINEKAKTIWFIRGAMLKSYDDYNILKSCAASPNSFFQDKNKNLAIFLSRYSVYPVTNNEGESDLLTPYYKHSWYANGERVSNKDNFTPKYGGRHYSFENGFLHGISSSNKKGVTDNIVFYTDSTINTDTLNLPMIASPEKILSMEDFQGGTYEVFDEVFDSPEEVMYAFTETHVRTLKNYINDFLVINRSLDPDDEEVWDVVMKHLVDACKKHCSIREQLRDTNENLDLYYDLAREEENQEQITNKPTLFDDFLDKVGKDAKEEINNDIDQAMTEHEELKDAENIVQDVVDNMSDLLSQAEELQKNDHDFAQEVANKIYRSIDSLKHELAELANTHRCEDLLKKLNNLNSAVI